MVTEVKLRAPPCMVAMAMGDHSSFYRPPWVDVEIPCTAVEALVSEVDQSHRLRVYFDFEISGFRDLGLETKSKIQGLLTMTICHKIPCPFP
jgi:hypothetical protein